MKVPTRWGNTDEWLRKVSESINQIIDGKIGSNSTVTLTANAASTAVKDFRLGKDSVVLLMPLTANAATALASTYITEANIAPLTNQFTITHANNAQTDRDFRYVILGADRN